MKTLNEQYAQALFEVASESDNIEIIWQNCLLFQQLSEIEPQYLDFLSNRLLSQETRQGSLQALLDDQFNIVFIRFLSLLLSREQLHLYPLILQSYQKHYIQHQNMLEILITTAIALDDEMQMRIQKKLESTFDQKVFLEYTIDPSLLGGLHLQMNDASLDASISHQLKELNKQLQLLSHRI